MTNSQRLDIVRDLLRTWFARTQRGELTSMEESILIRDGFYCGRRFRGDAFTAVWFAEEDQLKFYDSSGQWVDSVRIDAFARTAERRAA